MIDSHMGSLLYRGQQQGSMEASLANECEELRAQIDRLRQENERLEAELAELRKKR